MAQYTTTNNVKLRVETYKEVINPISFFKFSILYAFLRSVPYCLSAQVYLVPE